MALQGTWQHPVPALVRFHAETEHARSVLDTNPDSVRHPDLVKVIAAYSTLVASKTGHHIRSAHIRRHSEHPWNEFSDWVRHPHTHAGPLVVSEIENIVLNDTHTAVWTAHLIDRKLLVQDGHRRSYAVGRGIISVEASRAPIVRPQIAISIDPPRAS